MNGDSLAAVIEAEIVVIAAGGGSEVVVALKDKAIESLSVRAYGQLIANLYTFTLRDLSWSICDELALFKPVTEQLLRIRFRYGWNKPVWRYIDTPSMTPWLNASIIQVTPTFAEDAISLEIQATASQLEYVLFRENQPNEEYIPDAMNVKDLYTEVAKKFSIDLKWTGKCDAIPLPRRAPKKEANMTGLDYLANLFKNFIQPKIDSQTVVASFHPFSRSDDAGSAAAGPDTNKEYKKPGATYGVFEIKPLRNWKPGIYYEMRGAGSKVLSYSPELNPWIAHIALSNIETTVKDTTGGTISQGDTKADTTDKNTKKINLDAPAEVAGSAVSTAQDNMLANAIKANMVIVGDPYLCCGDHIGLHVFHPQTGQLKSTSIYLVIGVSHDIQNGMFMTSVDVVTQPEYQSYNANTPKTESIELAFSKFSFLGELQDTLRQLPTESATA